jgi:hypothetical protein
MPTMSQIRSRMNLARQQMRRAQQRARQAAERLSYELNHPQIEIVCGCGYRIKRRVIAGQRLLWTCPRCGTRYR